MSVFWTTLILPSNFLNISFDFVRFYFFPFFEGKVPLKTSRTSKNKFERGQTDVFTIDAKVGEVQKIT